MKLISHWIRLKRRCLIGVVGAGMALPIGLGNCDLGSITTTTTTTLSAQEVISQLLRAAVLTPINLFLNEQIDNIVNHFEEEDS